MEFAGNYITVTRSFQRSMQLPILLRPAVPADLPFLQRMLFEAFFWHPASPRPEFRDFARTSLEFQKLLAGWGRPGDLAVIAESGTTLTGAAWYRFWTQEVHSYGYVDPQTPELGLGVDPVYRRQGIGRRVLSRLLALSLEQGVRRVSLSVDPHNHALQLYQSLGFEKIGTSGTSWTMLWQA